MAIVISDGNLRNGSFCFEIKTLRACRSGNVSARTSSCNLQKRRVSLRFDAYFGLMGDATCQRAYHSSDRPSWRADAMN
jgi:hypothetical protein